MIQKRILCAALYFDNGESYANQPKNIKTGFIIAGRRHDDCYTTLSVICCVSSGTATKFDLTNVKRGFLSSDGFFCNRKEAYVIALQSEHLGNFFQENKDDGSELTSEQLY